MKYEHTVVRKAKNLYHKVGAVLANIRYWFPSRNLIVIGVTGTDGKTTTSHLIYHILKSAGKSVSVSTTIYADIAGKISDTGLHVTTQNASEVQKNLRQAVNNKSRYFVLETTSHGIDQSRVWGVTCAVAVLTNVTPEHLDYHRTYDAYLKTKARLLLNSKHAVINKDDGSFDQIRTILDRAHKKYTTYSLATKDADIVWNASIKTDLKESFNKENILAAIGVCRKLGIADKDILAGIKSFTLPKGRFDTVYDGKFRVMIDFAHTPNSIRRLLGNFDAAEGRVIHVFGSAGLRDDKKRPDMGRASGEHADLVILTEEDYRTEEFTAITHAISEGLFEMRFTYVEPHQLGTVKKGTKQFTIVKNRQKAIETALEVAKKGDVVLITGKGHEQSLARGTKEYPWDDYKAVKDALR